MYTYFIISQVAFTDDTKDNVNFYGDNDTFFQN